MKHLLVLVAIFLLAAVHSSAAQTPTPKPENEFKNAVANTAVKNAETAIAKAKAEYDKAVIAAKTKLISELEPLKEKAAKAGDLDEAVKLRDTIAALKEEIAALTDVRLSVVGEWNVVSSLGVRGVIELNADGSALADRKLAGRWTIEKGTLVIRWATANNVSTYSAGTKDVMIGKSTLYDATLTATRVKK